MDKVKQGKANRQAGARFELKVRKDLENKGWIVDKWSNNVELMVYVTPDEKGNPIPDDRPRFGNLISAKHKFRGKGIPMAIGTGFPDFIAFTSTNTAFVNFEDMTLHIFARTNMPPNQSTVIGVEVKSNGYLKPEEKDKCSWLLDNNKFSKIFIAKKGTKRGEITYEDFR